ncbi:MAG: hypothetical protein K2X82_21020 [Gemmataceae bacterium]|nr:hypothetical protein [Gemmataceae bacterium]
MTPERFVSALVESVRHQAAAEADYLAAPPSPRPPDHLARFAAWFRGLTPDAQATAREVIRYAAEGALFGVLTYLDNLASFTAGGGTLELWHATAGGGRVRLNDPDGELLTDLFNSTGGPATE